MFTSVTKKTFQKGAVIYLALTAFLLVFTYIYEQFSYGESSIFMRTMFVAPIIAAVILFLASKRLSWVTNRASLLLLNSSVSILVSAGLVKGIVEVSGRTTTVDQPYWYVAIIFAILSLLVGMVPSKKRQERI